MADNQAVLPAAWLLTSSRWDRSNALEDKFDLLFTDRQTAVDFARRLALSSYGMPDALPEDGDFGTPELRGGVMTYDNTLTIDWTYQPSREGGSVGDTHAIEIAPVGWHTPQTRLDFWNGDSGAVALRGKAVQSN